MLKMKSVVLSLAVLCLGMQTNIASAGVFNSLVSNPFVFCSAPKPCKYCHPFRKIWEEICKDQQNASHLEAPDPGQRRPPFSGTPQEIREEIERLTPIWEFENSVSATAGQVLDQCVGTNGRVQDGFCTAEKADFDGATFAAVATLDEISRLEAILEDCDLMNGGKPNRRCSNVIR